MKQYNLSGKWNILGWGEGVFPGTLDTNGFGYEEESLKTRLRRRKTFVGKAVFERDVEFEVDSGNRAILTIERAKRLELSIDGNRIEHLYPQTVSTPHVWDVTEYLTGHNRLTIMSDNSYEGWPAEDIIASSASTDETQINYNGLLGNMVIEERPSAFLDKIRVRNIGEKLVVDFIINSDHSCTLEPCFSSQCLEKDITKEICVKKGENRISITGCVANNTYKLWDEYQGNMCSGTLSLREEHSLLEDVDVEFGIREYKANENHRLTLNNRVIFIRSEANCGLFPQTGHEPMSVDEWTKVLNIYRSYGVNYMRFHSHTPPEAAFYAADRLGMLMQPELSCWNHETAFESDIAFDYYRNELEQILLQYGKHPSFVALTLGNELRCGQQGVENMGKLIELAKNLDNSRLYAVGSNCWYGDRGVDEYSDFYTSSKYYNYELRGTFAAEEGAQIQGVASANLGGCINRNYPNNISTFDDAICEIRKKSNLPVFGFEVGQFEVLPDFAQIEDYTGVTAADNIECVRQLVVERGISTEKWKRMVEATGEMALMAYKKEVELTMLTTGMSGISLLGLQDFTGQGTALVGMLDANLNRKPYDFSKPERFREFFSDGHPILLLEKYTYETSEILDADVVVVEDGKRKVVDHITREFSNITRNSRIDISVSYNNCHNAYSVWVYVPVKPEVPYDVYETAVMDNKALDILKNGGKVFYTPEATKEAMPKSITCHFTTDFWSKGTFPAQEGSMGQLIDEKHPIFRDFPTDYFTNYQWWPMAMGRCMIIPDNIEPIVQELDSIDELKHMAQLFECKVGTGYLMMCTMGLKEKQQYPECRALLNSIYCYLSELSSFDSLESLDESLVLELV